MRPSSDDFVYVRPGAMEDLVARIHRLDHPVQHERSRGPEVSRQLRCPTCEDDNHAHKAYPVGPFSICCCLNCPVLVIP